MWISHCTGNEPLAASLFLLCSAFISLIRHFLNTMDFHIVERFLLHISSIGCDNLAPTTKNGRGGLIPRISHSPYLHALVLFHLILVFNRPSVHIVDRTPKERETGHE